MPSLINILRIKNPLQIIRICTFYQKKNNNTHLKNNIYVKTNTTWGGLHPTDINLNTLIVFKFIQQMILRNNITVK